MKGSIQNSILQVIAYFDIFYYPLSIDEIKNFLDQTVTQPELEEALTQLMLEEAIYEHSNFYSLQNKTSLIKKRLECNKLAAVQLKKAKRIAAFLGWFPFIKGVAVSGSLSKQVAYENSDIDFFIITRANRLWIAKMFLSVLIKIATLAGLKKWFCLNYVIDETYLEVEEKNIFTATEIITLMPLQNSSVFHKFFKANEWVYLFFPNQPLVTNNAADNTYRFPIKIIEWLLDNDLGNEVDNAFMKFCSRRWKKLIQQEKFMESGFQLGTMMVDKHFCRPYPEHFQQKILDAHRQNFKSFQNK